MNLSSGVSLGQFILAFAAMLLTSGVAWGGLLQRVKTLEKEVEALSGIDRRLTTIEEMTKNTVKLLDQLTSSWLFREPPFYDGTSGPPHHGQRK